MMTELNISGGLSIKSHRTLFDDQYLRAITPHVNYDVAPDGSGLLFPALTQPHFTCPAVERNFLLSASHEAPDVDRNRPPP